MFQCLFRDAKIRILFHLSVERFGLVVVGGVGVAFVESEVLDYVQESVLVHEIGPVLVHFVLDDGEAIVDILLYKN